MTLRTLWQLCDVSFNLEMKPSAHNQKIYLAELSDLLALEGTLRGNGVPEDLLAVFEKMAALVKSSNGQARGLIHGFYYVGVEVRHRVRIYCRAHKIKTSSLMATRESKRAIAGGGLKGDANFKHRSLPYKER